MTHKLFLHPPAADLPLDAMRPDGLTIWMLRPVTPPIAIDGLDFTPGANGIGGTFTFASSQDGRYQIIIDTSRERRLCVRQRCGAERRHRGRRKRALPGTGWIPRGSRPIRKSVTRLLPRALPAKHTFRSMTRKKIPTASSSSVNFSPDVPDYRIYYNDVPIGGGQAINGEISSSGGHTWSVVPGGDPDGFGNQRGIDTWAMPSVSRVRRAVRSPRSKLKSDRLRRQRPMDCPVRVTNWNTPSPSRTPARRMPWARSSAIFPAPTPHS
ncbi:MAG: hypothetical protein R2851_04140 [Caldilineaceae bacterium]